MMYPGHPLKTGENNRLAVLALQHIDPDGLPLKIDSIAGPITWASLFGPDSLPRITGAQSPLVTKSLEIAASQIGVLEQPPGSNRGPQVDEYLLSVGLDPAAGSYPWCAAFAYWSFNKAAKDLGISNPVIKTAGVLDHWNKACKQGVRRLLQDDVINDISLLKPGLVFIISTGGGNGYEGLVENYEAGKLVTIEGNTNIDGGREGIGVFRRTGRKLADINKGFIDYST